MRVLVATAPFLPLTSAQTGAAMARAWAELGAQLAVVPIAEAGRGFGQAWADLVGADTAPLALDLPALATPLEVHRAGRAACVRVALASGRPTPDADHSSSAVVGRAVAAVLAQGRTDDLWLELDAAPWREHEAWHDGGAGFLHALGGRADVPLDGGVAALAGIIGVELAAVRELVGGTRLHLVTGGVQTALHLTGLRGITSVRGQARGEHPATMLATDQALADLVAALALALPDAPSGLGTAPGAGALGGLGAAVLALGGEVLTGPEACARVAGLAQSIARCSLVVTGYDELEFGSKGGDLLPLVTGLAEQAGRPVVALARRNWISARELRTMGIENGYGLAEGDELLDEAQITAATMPVARTWSW